MEQFYYSTNVLMNTNIKRSLFYLSINDFHDNSGTDISYSDLISIGAKSNMSKRHLEDEIIGCLYANFLVAAEYTSKKYIITDRALRDFKILKNEGRYQEHQISFRVYFDRGMYKLFIWWVETLNPKFIENLQDRKWTKNKSKLRLLKKTKSITEVLDEIKLLTESISPFDNNEKSFLDIIRTYGRHWSTLNTYTANLSKRCSYTSKTIIHYHDFYKKLIEKVGNSVDWGGKPITIIDFKDLMKQNGIDGEKFKIFINDGMIRYLDENTLTITGYANTVIESFFEEPTMIDIIIRSKGTDFTVLIGKKSIYTNKMNEFFSNLTLDEFGWYQKNKLNKNEVVAFSNNLIDLFNASRQIKMTI